MHYCTQRSVWLNVLDEVIRECHENNIHDIVILTLKTERNSILTDYVVNQKYRECYFTSCRKFKGLEADAVILVDFSEKSLLDDIQLFYVGASRARIQLEIITDIGNDSSRAVFEKLTGEKAGRRVMRDLASRIAAIAVVH